MQDFQRDLETFEGLDTQVLAVSDDDIKTHRKFAKEYDLTFPLISDENKEIAGMYGNTRITYLIDKEGIIRFIQRGRPYNADILKYVRKVQGME